MFLAQRLLQARVHQHLGQAPRRLIEPLLLLAHGVAGGPPPPPPWVPAPPPAGDSPPPTAAALPWRIPFASIRSVTSTRGRPAGMGSMSRNSNRARLRLSFTRSRSPWRTWMATPRWPPPDAGNVSFGP